MVPNFLRAVGRDALLTHVYSCSIETALGDGTAGDVI